MQRRYGPLIQFIMGIALAVFFSRESMAEEMTTWKDRFFAEAPKCWEDYLRFGSSLQVTVTATRYVDANGKRSKQSSRQEFKQSKGAILHVDQDLGAKGEAKAEGTNPSYSFKLKRRSPDSGWIITGLDVPKQPNASSAEQRSLQEIHLQSVCGCLKLWNLWLPTLIHDPDFKITAIKNQEIDGRPAVRFDFDYPKPDKDYPVKGAIPLKGGWMVLDPEHDWILRDYLVHTGQPEKYFIRKTFQVREGTGRHPIIIHSTTRIVIKGESPSEVIAEGQCQTVEQSDVPLEELTLSAFGLPEPVGRHVGRSRLYLWIALAGIVCLGIAALIRWRSRRARAAV